MNFTNDLGLWIGWLIVAGLLCQFALHLLHQFSPEFRERRKRRRNYGRVIARRRRPMVMLSAHTPEE